ncbi:MAG: hypothetical protein HYZ81_24965 [Nitrospinae bacterium]|nr:hypothetical protein [Nitrospinota bacterium]
MAASKTGLACWLGLITLLWSLHPLLFSRARGVLMLMMLTGMLALVGWLTSIQPLVVWSGGLGLLNLTLSLVLTAHPPNLWVGLSAGITLLALLDGSQRFAYLRRCQVEPGVFAVLLGVFMRITGLSLAAGVTLALLVVNLPNQDAVAAAAGLLTIAGAGMFVALVALLLLYTSRNTSL